MLSDHVDPACEKEPPFAWNSKGSGRQQGPLSQESRPCWCLSKWLCANSRAQPGCAEPRNQLIGLTGRELLARLGLDVIDEACQVATRLGGVVRTQIGLHCLQLVDEARRIVTRQVEALDRCDLVARLRCGSIHRDREVGTHRTVGVVAIRCRTGDGGGADGKRTAGDWRAVHRGTGRVSTFIGSRWCAVGDGCPLWAGGIDGAVGGHAGEAQVVIRRVNKLVGPNIAGALSGIRTAHPALVGAGTTGDWNAVDGRTALQQGDGLG